MWYILGVVIFLMKKVLVGFLTAMVVFLGNFSVVFAGDVGGTLLPKTDESVTDCIEVMQYVNANEESVRRALFVDRQPSIPSPPKSSLEVRDVLGCGIKTGDISLWMIPYYIRYILEFAIQISGLVAVGGIVFGGYLYLFAGVSEDKDRGKKAILYSVAGMVLTLVAWAVVNIVIAVVTA